MKTSHDLSSILSKFGSPLIRNNSRSSLSKIASDEYSEMTDEYLYHPSLGAMNDDNEEVQLFIDQDDADLVSSSQRRQLMFVSVTRKLSHGFATLILGALVIAIPVLTYNAIEEDAVRSDIVVYVSAGAFSILTVLVSFREIYMHLTNFYRPDIQKYVVRILLMVPIYAIQSWLSLMFFQERIFIDTLRDLYEAFVIASFVYLMIELLGGETALGEILDRKDDHYSFHPWPMNYFMDPWKMGEQYLFECKYGALQYVVFKVLASILIAILEPIGLYREGSFSFKYAYVYISFVIDLSQTYALYALVKILHATHDELQSPINWNPLGKAACVKLVVFFTWWQGIIIAFLQGQGIIHDIGNWDADHVAISLQDYLIIIEMFVFAVAHTFTFSYQEFLREEVKYGDTKNNVGGQFYDYTEDVRGSSAPLSMGQALWKSSIPRETFSDINRLKSGISKAMSHPIGIIMNVQDAESI